MNLTLDDLFATCSGCKGTGKNPEEQKTDGGRRYGTILRPLRLLILKTARPAVAMAAAKMTESGQALLDFVRVVTRRGLI